MLPENEAGPGGWVPGPSEDEYRAGAASRLSVAADTGFLTSPRCSPAACAIANLATADLLARARVSWASRDVSDAMVSTGLLEKVTAAIGQPVGPDQWMDWYRASAERLAAKLEPRRRELRRVAS